jgi:hypothetical protein
MPRRRLGRTEEAFNRAHEREAMSVEEFQDDASGPKNDSGQELTDVLAGSEDASFVATDEKKPLNRTTLVLMAVVALGGGGLYFMHLRTGPSAATAATQSAAANQTITQFLSNSDTSVKGVEKMLNNTQKIVQQFLKYPSVNQVPLNQLQTNPFRQAAAKEGESVDDAELRRKREDEKIIVRRAADGLQLQSILLGTRKACMINNTMVIEGQTIDEFTIDKINAASVIISRSGFRFELHMQK